MRKKRDFQVKAVEIIGQLLSDEYGWHVWDDADECEGQYIHVERDAKSGYHELTVMAASFDAEGNGSCVVGLQYGDSEDACLDIEVFMCGWKTDVSEIHDGLVVAFGGAPKGKKASS
jgi:hypothetical protein